MRARQRLASIFRLHLSRTSRTGVLNRRNCLNCAPLTDEGKTKVGKYLSAPSLANIKHWRFESEERTTFIVRYVYRIEGKETELSENPDVEVNLPLIEVTAKPVKPTVLHSHP